MTDQWMGLLVAVGSLLLQGLGLVVAGVWLVGKLNTTTEVLSNTILSLRDSINELKVSVNQLFQEQRKQSERLVKVEAFCERHDNDRVPPRMRDK